MGKFEKYIIVSDLDGTFFGAKSDVLPNNIVAIDYFKENGGHFTFATGRDVPAIDTLIPNARDIVNIPGILSNGSFIFDFQKREKHFERCLDTTAFKLLIKSIIERFPDIGIRMGIREPQGFFCPNYTPLLQRELEPYKKYVFPMSLDEMPQEHWYKAVLMASSERLEELREYISTLDTSDFNIFRSSYMLLEILSKDATKGKQLPSLKEYIGRKDAVCIGVGDFDNDFELLTEADIAACPENAVDKIKQIADIRLCHHADGAIADLIYKLDKN